MAVEGIGMSGGVVVGGGAVVGDGVGDEVEFGDEFGEGPPEESSISRKTRTGTQRKPPISTHFSTIRH